MRDRCGACGLRTERGEDDYFLGSMTFNLIAAELIAAGAVGLVILLTLPRPPWNLVMYGGAIVAVIAPLALYPLSKMLWLAVDLAFRPVLDDFDNAD